jgi:uncharacterized membrane protein
MPTQTSKKYAIGSLCFCIFGIILLLLGFWGNAVFSLIVSIFSMMLSYASDENLDGDDDE